MKKITINGTRSMHTDLTDSIDLMWEKQLSATIFATQPASALANQAMDNKCKTEAQRTENKQLNSSKFSNIK